MLSHVQLFETPWIIAHQAPMFMGFSRHEYWSGLPFSPPGDLPDPGIETCLLGPLHWQVGSLPLAPPGKLDATSTYLEIGLSCPLGTSPKLHQSLLSASYPPTPSPQLCSSPLLSPLWRLKSACLQLLLFSWHSRFKFHI